MSKHWAKIRDDIIDSRRMAALGKSNPLAYALYMNAKAVSDDYGRMTADADRFAARACPLWGLSERKVEEALQAMHRAEVINIYEVNGDRFLEITGYHEVEETNWHTVGRPNCPHPPNWNAPKELCELVLEAMAKAINSGKPSKATLERYQLEVSHFGPYEGQVTTLCGAYEEHMKSIRGASLSISISPSISSEEAVSDSEQDKPEYNPGQYQHMHMTNDPLNALLQAHFCSGNPPAKSRKQAQEYALACKQQVSVNGADILEADLTHALETGNGPRPGAESSNNFGPERWVERLRKDGSAGGPDARADPVLAQFTKANPKPSDPIALQVWHAELRAFREEQHEHAATA